MGEEADADWDAGMIEAGREMVENEMKDRRFKAGWRDPECPKCGFKLGNRMGFVCRYQYCPSGLN